MTQEECAWFKIIPWKQYESRYTQVSSKSACFRSGFYLTSDKIQATVELKSHSLKGIKCFDEYTR